MCGWCAGQSITRSRWCPGVCTPAVALSSSVALLNPSCYFQTNKQVPRKLIGTDGFQETPIVEVTRAITKHNYLVMDIADLPRVIKEVRGC